MKRTLLAISFCAALAGCGSGGGGGNGSGSSGGYAPNGPTVYNTSNAHYVPLYAGNTWTFSSGGKIVDGGTYTLTCSCGANGHAIENLDLYTPSGSYDATFVLAKNGTNPENTILLGTSTNHGSTIQLIEDAQTVGLAFMTDAPVVGASQSLDGTVSTITAVGQSQTYQDGVITGVASDTIAGPSISMSWGFARGVGFAFVSESGQTIVLTSFSIDAVHSTALAPSTPRASQAAGTISLDDALRTIGDIL